jgi:negative regulator of genetic competence, sporulation and motility
MVYIQIILATMLILALVIMMMQVTNILNQYRKTVQQNYMLQVEVNRLKAKEKEAAKMLARLQEDSKFIHQSDKSINRLETEYVSKNLFELVE